MTNEQLVEQIRSGYSVTDNMQTLYQNNLPMIKQIVKPYAVYEPMEDLLQEVYFGLWEAVQHYEASENAKFMTYATYWIKQTALRYIENCGSVIRIPSATKQKILRYKKAVERLSQEYGRMPTDKEIAESMCISISALDNLKKYSQSISSLDAPLNCDTEDTIGSTLKADYNLEEDTIDKIHDDYTKSELWGIVERYTNTRENEVIKSRFINNDTLQMIADREEITRQRVRDLEASAIRKLRRGKAKRELQEKFDMVDCGICRNGVAKFKEHNFTSTVEYIAIRRAEIKEEYEKRLRDFEELRNQYKKCL